MKVLVYDIEADDLDASVIYCLVTQDLHTGEVTEFTPENMDKAFDHLCTADRLIGHNVRMFDDPTVERLLGDGRKLPPSIDTLILSRFVYSDQYENPVGGHGLADWGKYLGSEKIDFHDWSGFSLEMLKYCRQDVNLTAKVYRHLIPKVLNHGEPLKLEHAVATLIQQQIQNGVEFFPDRVLDMMQTLDMEIYEQRELLRTLIRPWFKIQWLKTPAYWYCPETMQGYKRKGDAPAKIRSTLEPGPQKYKLTVTEFNPSSGDHIAKHFTTRRGWRPKFFTDSGKPITDERTVKQLAEKYEEAKVIARIRLLNKRKTQAQSWLDAQVAGRIHGDVITLGTVTHRMSHSKPNLAQVPKVGKEFGTECRSCFGPRHGWTQVGCDASGLQARLLGHYIAEFDGGKYADVILSGDIHEYNRQAAGLKTRANAKTFFYGYLFGAGDAKIGEIINGTAKQGLALKEKFRDSLTGLSDLEEVLAAQCLSGYIIGLDGRPIILREAYRALNSLLMSAEAIIMKRALVLFYPNAVSLYGSHGERWALMLNVHDEVQMECEPEIADGLGRLFAQSITAAGEYYNLRIRLDGEYKVGRNWSECH